MKRIAILFAVLAVFLWVGAAMATSFSDLSAGKNITINDTIWNSVGSAPTAIQGGEDNETERTNYGVSTIASQYWDLEGMFLNLDTKTLTIIGGRSFGDTYYPIGDLFIGNWGTWVDTTTVYHGKKFDPGYVLDFSRNTESSLVGSGTYSIYGGSFTTTAPTDVPMLSNPWAYESGGTQQFSGSGLVYKTGEIASGAPFDGWAGTSGAGSHYYLQIAGLDAWWSSIVTGPEDIFHITWKCGNDTLRGTAPVPEPATMLLFGTGLIGMAAIGRKKFLKRG